jgi:peptidoglycan/LPS O-acetylase OafA/YrhL
LNRPTSLFLDLLRFLAATVVFLGHAAQGRWSGGLLWQFTALGVDAVMIFFVLSGFVIAYAATERERSARTYAINRLARVYSVVIPTLILTIVLDKIGIRWNPSLYLTWPDYVPDQVSWQFLNSILFANQVWFNHVQPGTIGPYWSMGYEVPYYVAFGIAFFAPRPWAWLGFSTVMLAVGPNVAAFLPIWLMGFVSYRVCVKRPLGKWIALVTWVISIAAVASVVVFRPPNLFAPFDIDFTPRGLISLFYYYMFALFFSLNLVGFQGASPLFSATLELFSKPIRWMGQRTFALYLLHMPIIQFIVAVAPEPPTSWQTRGLVFLVVPLVVFGFAEFTERRKDGWRKVFDVVLGGKARLGATS